MRLHFVRLVNVNTDGWLNCILLILVTANLTEGSRHCVLCVELLALRISQWLFSVAYRGVGGVGGSNPQHPKMFGKKGSKILKLSRFATVLH